jgi:hypothetical protein
MFDSRNRRGSETRKITALVLALAAAATLPLGERADAQAQNDHRIVPWERVGPVELGMSAAELFGVMGRPSFTTRGALDRGVDVYTWKDNLAVTIKKDGSYVTQICALNPAYATAEGVHPGATDQSVAALLGQPESSKVHKAWWRQSYTDLYWRGLMISIPLTGFDTNHLVRIVCVNKSS